jgi:hypothetical protein
MRQATARLVKAVETLETAVGDPQPETEPASRVTVDIGHDRVVLTAMGAKTGAGRPHAVEIGKDAPIEINIDGMARVRIRCAGGNVEVEARTMAFTAAEDIAFDAKNITLRAAERVQLLGKEVDTNHHLKVLGE